jgi:hypothetical protein
MLPAQFLLAKPRKDLSGKIPSNRIISALDQGIMGLAYVQQKGQGSSIFDEAVKQGLMDHPIVSSFC